jgi:hypothetical protein
LALGCGGGTSFVATGTPPHPLTPRALQSVAVLRPPSRAPSPLVEVGRIEVSSGAHAPTSSGSEDALERLRAEAAGHGCEVVVAGDPHDVLFATSNGTPLYKTHVDGRCYVSP